MEAKVFCFVLLIASATAGLIPQGLLNAGESLLDGKLPSIGSSESSESNESGPNIPQALEKGLSSVLGLGNTNILNNVLPSVSKWVNNALKGSQNPCSASSTDQLVDDITEFLERELGNVLGLDDSDILGGLIADIAKWVENAIDTSSCSTTTLEPSSSPSTESSSTESSSTESSSTESSSTESSSTDSSSTESSSTESSSTEASSTESSSTESSSTEASTTEASSTESSTTEASTTEAPTTAAPTTKSPARKPSGSRSSNTAASSSQPNKSKGNSRGRKRRDTADQLAAIAASLNRELDSLQSILSGIDFKRITKPLPQIPAPKDIKQIPDLPDLRQEIERARNLTARALGGTSGLQAAVQKATQKAISSTNPAAALTSLASTIFQVFYKVATSSQFTIVSLAVIQDGLTLIESIIKTVLSITATNLGALVLMG